MEPTTRTRTILAFTDVKSNAELIRDVVVPLGYLRSEWRTVDPTYGLGLFWKLWRPEWLVASDLDPEKSPTHEPYDATALPWDDGAFRAGVIDGPYKLNGKPDVPIDSRYGVEEWRPAQARIDLVNAMIVEQARVLGDHAVLLVKCQAQINSARFWDQPRTFTETAEAFGFEKVDELLFPSYRAQPRRSTCVECGQKLMQRKNGEWAPVVRTSEQRPCVSSAGHTPGPDEQAHAHRNYSTLVVLGRGRWRE